jgi:integrase
MATGFISIPIENEDAYIVRSKAFGRYFRLRWQENGRYRYKSLKTRNYSQALSAAKLLMIKINRGLDPNTPTDYENAFESYMRDLTCGSKRRNQVAHIHYRHMLPFFGTTDVSKITTEMWERYKIARVAKVAAAEGVVRHKTLLHERSLLQAFLRYCHKRSMINLIPEITGYSKKNELISNHKQRGAAYTKEEIKIIFDVLRQRTDFTAQLKQEPYYRNMLYAYALVLFFSCGRTGEIRQLRVGDIEFGKDSAVITIRSETSKIKKSRKTAVPSEVAMVIKDFIDWSQPLRAKTGFIFYCHDHPIKPVSTINQTFKKLMIAEGMYKNDNGTLRPISSLRNSALTILSGEVEQAFLCAVAGTSARMLRQHYHDKRAEKFADNTRELAGEMILTGT